MPKKNTEEQPLGPPPDLKWVDRDVLTLKRNPKNPRVIRDEDFAALKEDIKRDPNMIRMRPILVSMAKGREDLVFAGNQRLAAVADLGWKTVPVIEVRGATPGQEMSWGLKDNLHRGTWDFGSLGLHFELDFLKDVGFDEKALDKILSARPNQEDDEYDAEKAKEAIAEPLVHRGEVWALGRHRLMCGDSTLGDDVRKLMNSVEADMVFTDPPYGVSYVGKTKDKLEIQNDRLDDEGELKSFLGAFVAEMLPILKPGSAVYVCAPAGPLNQTFGEVLKAAGIWRQTINWVKDRFVMGRSDYHYQHEPIFYGWKEGTHRWFGTRSETTIWNIPRPSKSAEHPTMKPLALVEKALVNSSGPGDLVYEPFAGSGSTLIACENMDRSCYAMELDEKYATVILKRWEEKTKKKATKLA